MKQVILDFSTKSQEEDIRENQTITVDICNCQDVDAMPIKIRYRHSGIFIKMTKVHGIELHLNQ